LVRRLGTVVGLLAAVALLVSTVLALVPGFGHGIDVSDEGLYLVAADAPAPSYNYVGLWGAYLHPLFAVSGYRIDVYRAVGAVLLALAAWTASRGLGRLAFPVEADRETPDRARRRTLIFVDLAFVSASLVYYALYLVTPSYNWLVLVGVLVASGGLLPLLAPRVSRADTVLRSALVAFGTWIAFVGRPTAGVGLAFACIVVLAVASARSWRERIWSLAVAAAFGLGIVVCHLLLVMGLGDTVEAFSRTVYFTNSDATAHGFSALLRQSVDQFQLVPSGVVRVAGVAPLIGLAVLASIAVPRDRRQLAVTVSSIGAVALCAVVIAARGGFGGGPRAYSTLPFSGLALILTAGLAWLSAWLVLRRSVGDAGRRARWLAVGAYFLVAALLYSFSSNNGIVYQMHGGFVLLLVSALALMVGTVGLRGLLAVALLFALIAGVAGRTSVHQGSLVGYRTAPPSASTVEAQVSHRGAVLLLGPDYAAFYRKLDTAAAQADFVPGTPLVDLTPFSPGVGYAMGALPPTTLLLGFSPTVARWALEQQDPARWHDAWLLVAPSGPRAIDPATVTTAIGRSFPTDYELVATLSWPERKQTFELWRPRTR
jgi:hypothetical protein